MKSRMKWAAMAVVLFCGLATAQGMPDRARLTADILYFTLPYSLLEPPMRDLVGVDLGLDYVTVKYRYGFANVPAGDVPVTFRKREPVQQPDQLAKIEKMTGLKLGQPFTLVAPSGMGIPGKIVGFSFVGSSPSTVIVAADIKPDRPAPELHASPGIALRGAYNLSPVPGLRAAELMKESDPQYSRLVSMCTADSGPSFVVQDEEVMGASLSANGDVRYFVSFWRLPKAEDFEVDDAMLYSCLYKTDGAAYAKANLPVKFRLVSVQDLDRDGKAELFAKAGDGAEVCHLYLTPAPKGDGYVTVKKGLCAGY